MLIYSHTVSSRLQYICKFVFEEQLGVGFKITIDSEAFKNATGPRLNYSNLPIATDAFQLHNHPLLFEKNITQQQVELFEHNGYKAFFKNTQGDWPFDMLAACFYLLSRYEEYLPYEQDMYGRYAHQNSLAFKEGFLQQPLVNYWLADFGRALQQRFPALKLRVPAFSFTPTYDIDIAWSYRHKGLLRALGGFLKSPGWLRIAVWCRLKKDPFDCYDFLRDRHTQYGLSPIYFFLVASSVGIYDKNISPYRYPMWQLIKRHAKKYRVGLHPSWASGDKPALLAKEKKILETAANSPVSKSRQHYIRFLLPDTFERLIAAGITEDYSMGYGSINGFRASVASSFYWYNLKTDKATSLRLHPFCFMDANCFYEQKQTVAESFAELMYYYRECKKMSLPLITIFHNSFLGTDKLYKGWQQGYKDFLENNFDTNHQKKDATSLPQQ